MQKIIIWRGHRFNKRTVDMVLRAEAILGETLIVVQGSYNGGGVSASAGTHDGGGAVDFYPTKNPTRVVRALRMAGFAAWHRMPNQGPWIEHIHAIAVGDPDLSSGARIQVSEYYNGQNGLANHARDDGPIIRPIPTYKSLPVVSLLVAKRQFKAKKKSKRYTIEQIQEALNWRIDAKLKVDGIAGDHTKQAFHRFEKKMNAHKRDGVPTRHKLRTLLAGFNKVVL